MASETFEKAGKSLGEGLNSLGESMPNIANSLSESIGEGVQKGMDAIADGANEVGEAIGNAPTQVRVTPFSEAKERYRFTTKPNIPQF